jgi:hypothetical protein
MPRKQPFPSETDTQPDMPRPLAPAPKRPSRGRSEATTVRPPKDPKAPTGKTENDTKPSGIRSRKSPAKGDSSGASVDEVTADLSKDPRRERDD